MIYTENYQLRKPVIGVDNADVNDLNYNSDRIDEIMHSSQISLADAYDLNSTYNTGDVVMYEFLMYRCLEDNVTGVWNPEKWTRTTAGEESGGGADLDIYGEASGTAEASFSDGAEASLVECEIGIVPSQDLHGYSKPWAGGVGKNKFNIDENRIGIDYDDSSSLSRFWQTVSLPNGNYTISFNGNMTGISEISFGKADSMLPFSSINQHVLRSVMSSSNTALTVTIDASYPFAFIGVIKSDGSITKADIDNLQIQIETGNTATTYEPYSNICPISGHTDITVTVASTSGGSGEDYTVSLGTTYYGGNLDVTTGELEVTWGNIASYAGETLSGEWISSLDEYSALGTPTTGAQVVYELATPQTFNLTPTQVLTLLGQNYVSHDGWGTISLVYVKGDAPIKPNPAGAEIPLTGLEIDGKKFSIPSGAYEEAVLYEQPYKTANPSIITLAEDFREYDEIVFWLTKRDDSSYYDYIPTQSIPCEMVLDAMNGAISGRPNVLNISGWQPQSQYLRISVSAINQFTIVVNNNNLLIRKITGIKH